MSPDVLIEGLLFYKAVPMKKSTVAKLVGIHEERLDEAITRLRERLMGGAVSVVETDTELQLMTAPALSQFVESLRKDELKGDIGKAGIETLAIILYREPVTRAEIDRIRGVNSSFSVRALLVRGLIDRQQGSGGSHTYTTTPALMAHLGVERKHELPNFATIINSLEVFEAREAEIALQES